MTPPRAIAIASLAALALAGCGTGETIANVAHTAAKRGHPCEAWEVEPVNESLYYACQAKRDREAAAADLRARTREGEQLKAEAEGRKP
jgi:hypothetical protein